MKACRRVLCVLGVLLVALQLVVGQTGSRKGTGQHFLSKTAVVLADPLPGGTYTVGMGGYFPTIDSAFRRLSGGGILGAVTLSLTDTLYVAAAADSGSFTLIGPIAGAGPASRITIRPANNVAITIRGDGQAVLMFQNVSYTTVDGISPEGPTRLRVQALLNTAHRWNDAIDFIGNCDFVQIINLQAQSDNLIRESDAIGVYAADGNGAPDSCLVSGVKVRAGLYGIYVGSSVSGSLRPQGTIIRNNHVGSPTDSLIAWGIQTVEADGSIIEGNHVENMRMTNATTARNHQFGINAYGSRNVIIRNNVVHNLSAKDNNTAVEGILASGDPGYLGQNVRIYNNMVYDIFNRAPIGNTSGLSGIRTWQNISPSISFNTVYLASTEDIAPGLGSAAVWCDVTLEFPVVQNNILVNVRAPQGEGPAALRIDAAVWGSDNNDLYVNSAPGANIGRNGSSVYHTLADWKIRGSDSNSVSVLPVFRAPHLHIDSMHTTTEYLINKGTPVAGIVYDFDGQLRDVSTPDIGADEIVEVKSPGGIIWKKDPRNPVLSGGGGTGYSLAMNPYVIYNADSARFEMWFNRAASSSALRPWLVGYATSPDGSTWTQRPSAVLSPTPGAWDANTTEVPMVIRENGTYKMWYSSYLNSTSPGYIGYATSPDGINWTKHAGNPIFGPGTALWEAGGPFACSVMPVPGGYKIWYDAYDASANTSRIGYATSVDGIVWQRDTLHNPILTPGVAGAWDDNNAGIPRVLKIRIANSSDVYFMWYTGSRSDGRTKSGLVLSPDGITGWSKSPHNPVLGPDPGAWDGTDAGIGSVMLYKDTLHAWYDGGTRPSSTNLWHIGHATSRTPVTDVFEIPQEVPAAFSLEQNFPNPFNPTTAIVYSLLTKSRTDLRVYDLLGREVAVLVNEEKMPGSYKVEWQAKGMASGIYFYQLRTDEQVMTKKMILLR